MKKVSLAEVAKSLGVSKTLISMVLNNRGDEYGISPETQKRVLKKIKEFNYRPNLLARGLRTGTSNVIALVVADIANPFYSRISRSVEDYAAKHGYHLMVCSSDEDVQKEEQLVDMLVEGQRVNGLIISTTQQKSAQFQNLKEQNYPLVLIDRYLPKLNLDTVVVDNFQGAFDATEHLIHTGYKKIGMLGISPHHLSSIREREEGYKEALKKHHIKYSSKLVREIPFEQIQEGVKKAISELISPPHSVEALFVSNNNLAVWCLEAIRELKMRIPQDLALVSFDDIDLFRFSNPPVTAISQPIEDIGTKAVELLLERINSKDKISPPKKIVLPSQLHIRQSCGSFLKSGA